MTKNDLFPIGDKLEKNDLEKGSLYILIQFLIWALAYRKMEVNKLPFCLLNDKLFIHKDWLFHKMLLWSLSGGPFDTCTWRGGGLLMIKLFSAHCLDEQFFRPDQMQTFFFLSCQTQNNIFLPIILIQFSTHHFKFWGYHHLPIYIEFAP